MIKGGQSVAARVRRGESRNGPTSDTDLDWMDPYIASNGQRPSRKLYEEQCPWMDVVVDLAPKPDAAHRLVKLLPGGPGLNDEIKVFRLVFALRIDRCARSPGKHGADSMAPQRLGNRRRDVLKSRSFC